MDAHKLSDDGLLESLDHLIAQEREILLHVLLCLMEVDRRRLYSREKFESLFDFSTKRLGLSEDQAHRRIQAMRSLRSFPELKPKLESGDLTLSNLNFAQTHIRTEEKIRGPMPREEKVLIFELVSSVSRREAGRLLGELSSLEFVPRPDSDRHVHGDFHEIRITVPRSTSEKAGRIRGQLVHRHPDLSLGELFTLLCDLGISHWVEKTATSRVMPRQKRSPLHREIWLRDKARCTNCGSAHALEVDHVIPKAKGGTDAPENLRLLCRSCNQRAAIEEFGLDKVDPYLN